MGGKLIFLGLGGCKDARNPCKDGSRDCKDAPNPCKVRLIPLQRCPDPLQRLSKGLQRHAHGYAKTCKSSANIRDIRRRKEIRIPPELKLPDLGDNFTAFVNIFGVLKKRTLICPKALFSGFRGSSLVQCLNSFHKCPRFQLLYPLHPGLFQEKTA